MKSKAVQFPITYTLSVGLFIMLINLYAYDFHRYIFSQQAIVASFEEGSDSEEKFERKCRLPQLDPWDAQIAPFLDPEWNPILKNCKVRRLKMHTELRNSALRMLDNTTSKCEYRCLYTIGEANFTTGNWVLHQLYDATTFHYHNKVGFNSRPNAFAIFSGTRITKLDERYFPGKSAPEILDSCRYGVRKNETVTYDFVNQSYATLIAEDWITAFGSPNCTGYGMSPTDHNAAAMMLRAGSDIWHIDKKQFDSHFMKSECHDRYHKLLDFVAKFLYEYNGISKFAMVWLTHPAHDWASGLYRTDKYFADFFRKHVNNLNNSFVFVMGDHGFTFGKVRQTPVGAIEDNNPLLTVAVPKRLRSNEQLILNIKRNSRLHTSQYDIYATLYDIARHARNDNFRKWDKYDFRTEFGKVRGGRAKSLLRPILYDRTCEQMDIPEAFCICLQNWQTIDSKNKTVLKAAQALINHINDFLKDKDLKGLCAMLSLSKVILAEYLGNQQTMLKIAIKASPSNGRYEARLLKEGNDFKVISKTLRVDSYGRQAHCMTDEDIRPLCYCRGIKTILNNLIF